MLVKWLGLCVMLSCLHISDNHAGPGSVSLLFNGIKMALLKTNFNGKYYMEFFFSFQKLLNINRKYLKQLNIKSNYDILWLTWKSLICSHCCSRVISTLKVSKNKSQINSSTILYYIYWCLLLNKCMYTAICVK